MGARASAPLTSQKASLRTRDINPAPIDATGETFCYALDIFGHMTKCACEDDNLRRFGHPDFVIPASH